MLIHTLKNWAILVRLPSIMLAVSAILMGNFLAFKMGTYKPWTGFLALITASLLQIIANLANDYGDFIHGSEINNRVGNSAKNAMTLTQLKKTIIGYCVLTAIVGCLLLQSAHLSPIAFLSFITLGLLCINAAIFYTMGPKPYAYLGLGDIAVLSFFGPIAVFGTVYLHTHHLYPYHIFPALGVGILVVAILNLNNLRDIVEDRKISKKTLVVRFGYQWGLIYQWFLLISPILLLTFFTILTYQNYWQLLFLLTFPLIIYNGLLTMYYTDKKLNKVLGQLLLIQLLVVIFFGAGLLLAH